MKTDIFQLQVVPIPDIYVHEEYDKSRALPLVEGLKKVQHLVNPIIVAAISGGKYIQLDGMNRFSAFKMLGLKSILCQIIDYNDQESVELSSWSHLFAGEKEKFINFLKTDLGLIVKPGKFEYVGHRYIKEEGTGRLCTLCTKDGIVYLISSNGNLTEKIEKLNRLVSYYSSQITRDVLPPHPNRGDVDFLFSEHQNTDMMIIFPTFTRHQIVDIVKKERLFPSGVTRHIIRRRCLNVNAPLSLFNPKDCVLVQNQNLEKLLSSRKFRIYEEPTVYFE